MNLRNCIFDIFGWFGLVWCHSILIVVSDLMPNPFYTYIKYMICKHVFKITYVYGKFTEFHEIKKR